MRLRYKSDENAERGREYRHHPEVPSAPELCIRHRNNRLMTNNGLNPCIVLDESREEWAERRATEGHEGVYSKMFMKWWRGE
jgi:hypothetical protein